MITVLLALIAWAIVGVLSLYVRFVEPGAVGMLTVMVGIALYLTGATLVDIWRGSREQEQGR